jgi:hypothetical protein
MRILPWLVVAVALATSSACDVRFKAKGHAKVDGILLPQARGVADAPDGPTLHIPGDDLTTLPDAPIIRLAIARDVPWKTVLALMVRIEEAGKRPVLLVGKRLKVREFIISDELENSDSIALTATVDGKSCVSPPGVPEAKCVQPLDKDRIDRAHTRKLVREAMNVYHLTDVNVEVPPNLGWADVVRTIDSARTCCKGTEMRVKLNR